MKLKYLIEYTNTERCFRIGFRFLFIQKSTIEGYSKQYLFRFLKRCYAFEKTKHDVKYKFKTWKPSVLNKK